MQLTKFTDYSLRVLIYLGLKRDSELASVKQISALFDLSNNHIVKVVHQLGKLGYLNTQRGKGGGISLARAPKEINLGVLIRELENRLDAVECGGDNPCRILPHCKLKAALAEAVNAYLKVLDGYTLDDLLTPQNELRQILSLS